MSEHLGERPAAGQSAGEEEHACVYVLHGEDIGTEIGGGQIHGVSIVAADGGSEWGGKVWTPENGGDAYWVRQGLGPVDPALDPASSEW